MKGSDHLKAQRKADSAFSKHIHRERGDQCEVHLRAIAKGLLLPFRCSPPFCLCHKIPKVQSHSLRYDPRNVYWGCSGGNRWESFNRNTWFDLLPKLWPEDWGYLQERKKIHVHRKTSDLLWMIEEWKKSI